MPKTKIICTLGPASSDASVLYRMARAGMDAVRLNFSHGSHGEHLERIKRVRELNRKHRRHIRILADLEGYRIRVGKLKGSKPVEVKKRQFVWLTPKHVEGGKNIIPMDYDGPITEIKKGHYIYIDDGNIALRVESREGSKIKARVIVEGLVKEHKGINMPGVSIPFKGVTDKDKRDIDFCIEHQVDYIAQSFVRSKDDIKILKQYINKRLPKTGIIAKIENDEGIRNIDSIINICDGILVARGDMGISIPIYRVPIVQKMIINKCNHAGKFVITATQMLESMTENRIPTRAEVSDVANAILDGTDYVMLSGETAVGSNPANCVDMMNRIICYTEEHRNKF